MKKKVLVQVMGAVLVAGLMAGCGAGDGKTEDSAKTESAAETTEESADETAETESTDETAEADESENAESADETNDTAKSEAADSTDDTADTERESSTDEAAADQSTDSADAADKAEVDTEAATATDSADSDLGTVISAAGWNITAEDVEINASLENVSVDLGYTGVETSDYKKEADAGKTFCLVKMKIEKDGSKENFDWENLKLTDSEGNEYTRMEDDFISELGMNRMAGTTLNFGSNEGWIAFEIKDGAEGLELSYAFEEEEYHCAL